jgi:hypothetical protein
MLLTGNTPVKADFDVRSRPYVSKYAKTAA